ncbi:O-antigen/teichoic acid export membrane protein [Humibacillus xanthopallidus]|uniref:O-antigen/teichoic acid export membrane protein n=2 Tax=Humibacillus xanthopallidus TaxID=412689 RepID=A0A543I026_9MICO|nr:O-antigen/teichoic acid export membrane protein [Humibacillus xanthopallidus]
MGLGFFGLSTYVFTAVVLRALGPERFADFNLFWGLAYGVGLGAMLPFEQEVSRRTATAVHTDGRVGRTLTAGVTVALAFSVVLAALVLPFVLHASGGANSLLWLVTTSSFVALGIAYVSRGLLSGRSSFGRYSAQFVAEGAVRLALVGLCVAIGVANPWGYAAVVPVALLVAVAVTWRRDERLMSTSPSLVRDVALSMAPLVVASLISLTLVNLGPVAIRYVQDVPDPTHDGSYLAAAFIARLPIFAFAAVQAVLMPRLARAVVRNDAADFRATVLRVLVPTLALGLIGVVGVAVAGPWLLALLAGPQYDLPRLDMVLLTAAYACYLLTLVLQPSAVALGKHRASAVVWVVGALTFAVAWLLPTDASTAVSIAIATVSLTVSAGLGWVVRRGLSSGGFAQRTAYRT